jgi:hypothetical protein
MDEVERVSKAHYKDCREDKFREFAARTLEAGEKGDDVRDVDWESTFFVRHLPPPTLPTCPTSTTITGRSTHHTYARLDCWLSDWFLKKKQRRNLIASAFDED